MTNIYHLYIDDSGTRHPDRNPGRTPRHNHDYFALGGFLIRERDEICARELHEAFCKKWNIAKPLHSTEIRAHSKNFSFIGKLDQQTRATFYEDLYITMRNSPAIGIACVIDRPGYNHRYLEKYGRQRWNLCKTAFSVCVERAAKFALANSAKLKVFPERSDKDSDRKLSEYYKELRTNGMPFDNSNSEKYSPLVQLDLKRDSLRIQNKKQILSYGTISRSLFMAYVHGGYDPQNRTYKRLIDDGKLIDCILNPKELDTLGIKYSCWDLVEKLKPGKPGFRQLSYENLEAYAYLQYRGRLVNIQIKKVLKFKGFTENSNIRVDLNI